MVAEKPSIAESIAQALSGGSYKTRKGVSKVVKVHEYKGYFRGV
jgi:DNA topoisomerase III